MLMAGSSNEERGPIADLGGRTDPDVFPPRPLPRPGTRTLAFVLASAGGGNRAV